MAKNGSKIQYPQKPKATETTKPSLSEVEKAKEERRLEHNDTCAHRLHHCPYCKGQFNPTVCKRKGHKIPCEKHGDYFYPSTGCIMCKSEDRREVDLERQEREARREAESKAADPIKVFLTPSSEKKKHKPKWTEETRALKSYG